MNIILRTIAWILAAAVAFATLGPPTYRPHVPISVRTASTPLPLSWSDWRSVWPTAATAWVTAAIAVALIGLLEILQFWVPGRHARLGDFVVDALAACAGLALAAGLDWAIRRARRPDDGNVLKKIPAGTRPARIDLHYAILLSR